ncbi:helix-turn-helix domain-containing protein [Comamonas odontotermitis]|uniref:helix-turn-helix domain-containing protein n=1 Tax=Comamonas odontotermitis TaxID=379895 RepID=UPI003670BB33
METLPTRIKEARIRAGLSQEQLGIRVGLEPESASTRMNRYELGKRTPDFGLMERIAAELDLPTTYFYSANDDEAELLIAFHRLKPAARKKVLAMVMEAS